MRLLKQCLELIAPQTCLWCKQYTDNPYALCRDCFKHLPWNSCCCQCCAKPLDEATQTQYCASCITKPAAYANICVPFRYEQPIDHFLTRLKFQHQLCSAHLMGRLLQLSIASLETQPELIIPVPLHPKRLRQRGFNQAHELCKVIAKHTHIDIDTTSIQRIKNTKPQSSLSRKQRQSNIKRAFAITHDIAAEHIVLVDDIMTTGHTIHELYKTLKKSGVKTIDVWCCARA